MRILAITERPVGLDAQQIGLEAMSADDYLANGGELPSRGTLIINLCASYAYQKIGYYVSLLASARGHRALPDIDTLIRLSERQLPRALTRELQKAIDKSLAPLKSDRFDLSVYFGQTIAARYQKLGSILDSEFRAPLIRARFEHSGDQWRLVRVGPIAWSEVPEDHLDALRSAAHKWVGKRPRKHASATRAHLAILLDEEDGSPPSDEAALRRFEREARSLGVRTERIGRHDANRLSSFDALFIRTTTSVDHFTYRFARRAEAEGVVAIDDARSIVRCSNKVFLSELLARQGVPAPTTVIVNRHNRDRVAEVLGFPVVLKTPDGSFSSGVSRCDDAASLQAALDRLLQSSELVIAQQWLPTEFDWRVGVLDGRPLYCCQYFMAHRHWQIVRNSSSGRRTSGRVEAVPIGEAPGAVLDAAVKACALIGDGLYGVDLKQHGDKVVVIEVNDNPNLDAGYEDAVLGSELYRRLLDSFLRRIQQRRGGV